jgi:hypothetical protein
MQRRADKFEAAGYLGMTMKTLESTYGHHRPDHQSSVGAAFSKRRPKGGLTVGKEKAAQLRRLSLSL